MSKEAIFCTHVWRVYLMMKIEAFTADDSRSFI